MTGPWNTDGAVCAQTDPEVWFPEKGGSPAQAIALCRTCPLQAECLEYALAHPELVGVWGGTTAHTRKEMRVNAGVQGPLLSHAARGAAGGAKKRAAAAARAARAVELHAQGYGAPHIAQVIGVSVDTARRYISDPARDAA